MGTGGSLLFEPFYSYKNCCFFKTMYNDTVYFTSSKKDIIEPSYFINLGKYKLPDELRPERIDITNPLPAIKKSVGFYYCGAFEAANKVFLTSGAFVGLGVQYILYDKVSKNGSLLYSGSLFTNKTKVYAGLVNDWDGSVDFWPVGNVNDGQLYMLINIIDFKKEFDKDNSSQKSVKFPEKQKQLIKMISGSDVSNNPVIMVVTLKPDN